MYVFLCVSVSGYERVYMCVYVWKCVNLCVYARVCVCVRACMCVRARVYVYVCVCACMCVSVCVWISPERCLPPFCSSPPQPGHPQHQRRPSGQL